MAGEEGGGGAPAEPLNVHLMQRRLRKLRLSFLVPDIAQNRPIDCVEHVVSNIKPLYMIMMNWSTLYVVSLAFSTLFFLLSGQRTCLCTYMDGLVDTCFVDFSFFMY
jgi:hypothetical protein